MRRSKSDPAKYARNYRSISQRRMTEYDNLDEGKEMDRLRDIISISETHLEQARIQHSSSEKKRNIASKSMTADNNEVDGAILSEEMREQMDRGYGDNGNNTHVLMPKKKKAKVIRTVELTQTEIRQAKKSQKNANRKLNQLAARAEQKQRRAELYSKLEQTAISAKDIELLASSSTLGKRETKREALKRLLSRERAGLNLTENERNILYSEKEIDETEQGERKPPQVTIPSGNELEVKIKTNKSQSKSKKNGKVDVHFDADSETLPEATEVEPEVLEQLEEEKTAVTDATPTTGIPTAPFDFAAQMMTSLNTLKEATDQKAKEEGQPTPELERLALSDQNRGRKQVRYVPTELAIPKSAAVIGLEPSQIVQTVLNLAVQTFNRPDEVQESRNTLPVCSMEFEIVDAIRNNDVTILCSETGSGKSTQVPQFLYENGFTAPSFPGDEPLLIGVTQPRRVAAVSTAKRVCYEMGHGDGQVINGKNLVAYQTRYERAGLGSATRIKFMTDGILLQEIQSDLLLRKYGVIILDEAHQRNLNTDVLLGLLSVAIPLRRKASEEDGSTMKPLKLVIMSATLRVEDFTLNDKLFPSITPALVTVPGRTYPVTIHHSKITELDDYEAAAFKKTCQIHRKLPKGGILLFLTGKQEIVRMVNRLRNSLSPRSLKKAVDSRSDIKIEVNDVTEDHNGAPRDLDDDEIDGDIFMENDGDDFEDMDSPSNEDINDEMTTRLTDDGTEVPAHAIVLPLYSMLSVEEQARVFAAVPAGQRLIVVATNIAETSITIPGIAYVVDTGRQKCRNYHAGTGIASYDVMWISKAAADQRAGRAGRTTPGHCYRLYSSSMYSRHMESFPLPEILTRPLEDVVLAMKTMAVSNVGRFPFPTPPDESQVKAAIQLLASLGCIDLSEVEDNGGDGSVTRLGHAIAKLPLGVRYGKMLIIAAKAGVLDYAIAMVAILSESSPFLHGQQDLSMDSKCDEESDSTSDDEDARKKPKVKKWVHRGGDVLAGLLAVGAYSYAGRGAGGSSEKLACKQFCAENGLNYSVMDRIQQMRLHLAKLAKTRFSRAEGVAAKTGCIVSSMRPPTKLQENLVCQAIASGLLDNVCMLAPPGSLSGEHPFGFRSAFSSCSAAMKEPIYLDPKSALYTRDWRLLPKWVCYDTIIRKSTKDGTTVVIMKNVTPIDPSWLGSLAQGSSLLRLGEPMSFPLPSYDSDRDAVLCSVVTKFGNRGWEIPPVKVEMYSTLQKVGKQSTHFLVDDSFRWFARFLLEGKVLPELLNLTAFLNDDPSVITRKVPVSKVALLVSTLSSAGIDSGQALRKHWAEVDDKFLFKNLRTWTKPENAAEVKHIWMTTVQTNIKRWKDCS